MSIVRVIGKGSFWVGFVDPFDWFSDEQAGADEFSKPNWFDVRAAGGQNGDTQQETGNESGKDL